MKIKDFQDLVYKIEEKKKLIAKERDELNELADELEGLLESFNIGIESLEDAIAELKNGIEHISEVV